MKNSYWAWYALVGLAALLPAGVRALTWQHEADEQKRLGQSGDGLGPVFNATSCVACHFQGGPGGSGGLSENVTTFTVRDSKGNQIREGVVHARAINADFQETLALVDPSLPSTPSIPLNELIRVDRSGHCAQVMPVPRGVHVSQRNTPALFGAKLIDEISESDILSNQKIQRLRYGCAPANGEEAPVGRALRLTDGKIGRFGWKAQASTLAAFVQGACANELGLGNPGQAQPRPLSNPAYKPAGLDLTQEQCDQLTAFCASLPRPIERTDNPAQASAARLGKQLFGTVGCADCHTPNLGKVTGLYSDLLLHRMGRDLEGGGSYNDPPAPPPEPDPNGPPGDGPSPGEWRTPPLWGVADSAPYMHDGRAATLEDAIRLHGGQAARSAQRFAALKPEQQGQLVAFLKTLRAP
jgi:CxxC motif-containing protein (DUF1111 family)